MAFSGDLRTGDGGRRRGVRADERRPAYIYTHPRPGFAASAVMCDRESAPAVLYLQIGWPYFGSIGGVSPVPFLVFGDVAPRRADVYSLIGALYGRGGDYYRRDVGARRPKADTQKLARV